MKTTALIPKTFRLLLSVWLLSFSAHSLHAQFNNFPVSCSPFIVRDLSTDAPPWQWSNFYNSSTFLNLNLLLKDNKQGGDIDVFVRIKLERVGITISNPTDFVASKPIRLSFGSLKSLTGIDISENFLPQNLVVSGLEDSFVRQGGTLPDGLWTIKVTAYEFDGSRGYRQVSNEGIGQLMVFYGQPPMLLAPANTSEIDNSFSPNVLFNWLPKATATIGGLSNIAYEFELWELGDTEVPNENAIGKTPIFTKTVSSPMMLYDAHQQPPLKTGFHYAWRVRVIDATGNNAYENKGYSEVWSFRYGIKCSDTGNLQIKLLGGRTYRLTWNYAKNASSYEINWRERGKSDWQIENSHYNNFDLKLEESLAYEFRVRTVCQSGETGAWSETLEWEKEGEKRSQSSTSSARMSAGTESVGGTGTTTSTSTPEDDLNKVLNPLGNTVTSGDTDPTKIDDLKKDLNKAPNYSTKRCENAVKSTTASCEDDNSISYTGGTNLPSPTIGTKLYLNGYEIVLTNGNASKGEGLLFFPYLMKRIPVEWTGIQINTGEESTYGCIVGIGDKVKVQGSNSSVLSNDLDRQFTALAAWLNDPGSFTGTFGESLEAVKKVASNLLDKIAKGEPINKDDYKKYNNICKAIDKGLDAWKNDIVKEYGKALSDAEIKNLLENLDSYKTELKEHLDCDGTGLIFLQNRFEENTLFYSSTNENPFFLTINLCKLTNTTPLAIKIEKLIEKYAVYETDGHYSTVYLVALMLGIDERKASELAVATENPDTDIDGETDFRLDQTWSYPWDQGDIHSLTGGFHGIEEFITALKILYTPKSDTDEIGKLLHRFGDTYAHTKLSNLVPPNMTEYNLSANPQLEKQAIESWKGTGGGSIASKIEPWIVFMNYYTQKYGFDFLTNESLQKNHLNGKTLSQTLKDIYLIKPTDNFKMYGNGWFTLDHNSSDKGFPDLIYMRPEWYLSYVKNLAWILAKKYNLNPNSLDIEVFKKMIAFGKKNNCTTLKGIIDYEIAKKRGKQEMYVPVYYADTKIVVGFLDAIPNDYHQKAVEITNNTKKYIQSEGETPIVDTLKDWNVKFNFGTGFFRTKAFKITF